MLADNEVGKIKKESPAILGTQYYLSIKPNGKNLTLFAILALCVEMFIEQLITTAANETTADGARLLSAGHLYVSFLFHVLPLTMLSCSQKFPLLPCCTIYFHVLSLTNVINAVA
jgi:hypothetical protein